MTRLVLLLLVALSAHAGELYRWVDRSGKVHYSDAPPPPEARQVEEKRLPGNAVSSGELPYATRRAAQAFPVTLFVSECGAPCNEARAHLARRGIPYTPRNPAASEADADALRQLAGSLQVPVLVVGRQPPLKGYDAGAWDAALDAAGYPRSKGYGYKEPSLPRDAAPTGPAQ